MNPTQTVVCPSCEQPMERTHRHGVDIDCCPVCSGIWFDRQEIGPYVRGRSTVAPAVSDVTFGASDRQSVALSCPRCGCQELRAGTIRNVYFLRCGACHGLFFSGPELSALCRDESGASRCRAPGSTPWHRRRERLMTADSVILFVVDAARLLAELALSR